MKKYIIPFRGLAMKDIADVGGKNASLGEMIGNLSQLGIAIPDGFALSVSAFYEFLAFNCLSPQIQVALDRLNRVNLVNLFICRRGVPWSASDYQCLQGTTERQ
ncbi:MAG TPA: PEP/pyruvate-binding domain-containing protein [Chryseosolibacter sp.]